MSVKTPRFAPHAWFLDYLMFLLMFFMFTFLISLTITRAMCTPPCRHSQCYTACRAAVAFNTRMDQLKLIVNKLGCCYKQMDAIDHCNWQVQRSSQPM